MEVVVGVLAAAAAGGIGVNIDSYPQPYPLRGLGGASVVPTSPTMANGSKIGKCT